MDTQFGMYPVHVEIRPEGEDLDIIMVREKIGNRWLTRERFRRHRRTREVLQLDNPETIMRDLPEDHT